MGVTADVACDTLSQFAGVKRRMEKLADIGAITIYDDFAHHPTAIATTLDGLRAKVGEGRIIAVIEPRSNTMRMGVHASTLAQSVAHADQVLWFDPPSLSWDLNSVIAASQPPSTACKSLDQLMGEIIEQASREPEVNTHIVIMSNGGFGGLHKQLIQRLQEQ